jgi:putative oxidoreductase
MTANATTTETAADARPGRALNIALWVLQILLGVFTIAASGFPKVVGMESAAEGFDLIGWGDWFMYLIGALEIAGGVGLLVPRLSGLAAACLGLLMIGAAIFNVVLLDYPVATPLILLVLFAVVAWGRRDRTRLLLTRGFAPVG